MVRWFGNMMRTNGRALRLGWGEMGFFTLVVDPGSACVDVDDAGRPDVSDLCRPVRIADDHPDLHRMGHGDPLCVLRDHRAFRGEWFPVTHAADVYFGQVVGAFVKTFVLYRLNKQKWTRQGPAAAPASASRTG